MIPQTNKKENVLFHLTKRHCSIGGGQGRGHELWTVDLNSGQKGRHR